MVILGIFLIATSIIGGLSIEIIGMITSIAIACHFYLGAESIILDYIQQEDLMDFVDFIIRVLLINIIKVFSLNF